MDSAILEKVSSERLHDDLFSFCRDPFSFRTVTYTIPWHEKNSLDELDDFLVAEISKYPVRVKRIPYKLKPFRCDRNKPLHHWYSSPKEEDPWYDGNCIEVVMPGSDKADEIIQLVSHKDSMSWINSPGAHDNAVGTVANLEMIRVLSSIPRHRTIRVLFCNEEHTPWYSKTYAADSMAKGDNIIAVFNQDAICGKSDEDAAAGRKLNVSIYSTLEGKALAEFVMSCAGRYSLPIEASICDKGCVNDDDGSFVKAGYNCTIHNEGSHPYADSQYHLSGDIPERVDIENLKLATQLILAAVLDIDEEGQGIFLK